MTEFSIDLPNPADPEADWISYDSYPSGEEALAAARHHFGADREGRISVVSEVQQGDGS